MAMSKSRTERDSLGEILVPSDALYGARTVRCLGTSAYSGRRLSDLPALVRGLAAVKIAATRANRTAKVLLPEIADAITAAAQVLTLPSTQAHLVADPLAGGGAISLHVNVNEVLANLANESLGGQRGTYAPVDPFVHVAASQSTADVCHTAVRLAVLERASGLLRALDEVVGELEAIAGRFAAIPTLARTCLRDGLATTADVLFRGHAQVFQRRRVAYRSALQRLHGVTLGGTVIGDGSGAPPLYRARVAAELAAVTGLPLESRAYFPDALQNSDDLGDISANLAGIARAAIKLAQDLRVLGSGPHGGFGELILPTVQEGSSFFAGKSNPVVPESVLQAAFQILGFDHTAQEAVRAAELHLNVFDLQVGVNVLDASDMAAASLQLLADYCLHQLQLDPSRCLELAQTAQPSRRSS